MRLLTYNIHGCIGRDGVEDADRVLEVIREANADVVALQEVYDDDVEDRSFLRGLEKLGFASVVYGETMRKAVGPYGNILMSREPVVECDRIDLSHGEVEPRGAIRAVVPWKEMHVEVLATHLGLSASERKVQMRYLLAQNSTADIRVLMGDLNEWWPKSRNLKVLSKVFSSGAKGATFPVRFPFVALDRIFIQAPGAAIRYFRLDTPLAKRASDHRPMMAEICI